MSKPPDPWRTMTGEVIETKSLAKGANNRSAWFNSGAKVDGKGAIQSDNFDGDLANLDAGTTGWAMNADRAAFGELILRPGSIGNDSLTNPVAVESVYDSFGGFGLTTSMVNIRTKTVPVPAGFTKAAVSITVRVFAVNMGTTGGYDGLGGDYLYGQANINGYNGYALPLAVSGNGGSGTNISPFSAVLTGLTPGSSVSLQIAAQTAYANWAANAQNVAEISGSVQWYR